MDKYQGTADAWYETARNHENRYREGTDGVTRGLDTLDIYLNCSHGGISDAPGIEGIRWFSMMWANNTYINSPEMRLGNNNRQLKLFLSYDCGQMNPVVLNGYSAAHRWAPVFRGGLKYASAFWDSSWNIENESRKYGKNYAIKIHAGSTFRDAWKQAMTAHEFNTPSVLATGVDCNHCHDRIDGMKLSNFKDTSGTYRTLRDNQNVCYCQYRWGKKKTEGKTKNQNDLSLLKKDNVILYEVAKGPGNITVLNQLIRVISHYEGGHSLDQKSTNMELGLEYSFASHDGATLIVYEDGTKASYINEKAFQNAKKNHLPAIDRQRLEKLGMDFVTRNLSEYIVIGPNEKLILDYFIDETYHTFSLRDNKSSERLVGTQIVFTREIGGIPVVGPGSRVGIMFANDETPVGFDFDWPIYQRENKTQRIAEKETVFRRMSTLTGADSQIRDVNLEKVVCGYYDPGVQVRSENHLLQAACRAAYKGYLDLSEQGESSYGLVETIPVAEFYDIEYDPNWGENNRLFDCGDVSKNTPISPLWLKLINQ